MPESIDWPPPHSPHPPRRRGRLFLLLAVLAGIFFGSRTALSYYVDTLWFGSLGYARCSGKHWPAVGNLCRICGGHVSDSLWIVSGFEAGASARFAGRSHDSDWRTTAEAPGGAGVAHDRAWRCARDCRGHRRQHDGGVAGARAVLVCACHRRGRRLRSDFRQAAELFSAGTARLAAHRRLAAYSGCDYLCAGRFFHPHHGREPRAQRASQPAVTLPGAGCRSHSRFSWRFSRRVSISAGSSCCWKITRSSEA